MLNSNEIEKSVIAMVAGVLKCTVERDSAVGTVAAWDSLAQMKIIIQLEDTYDLEIEDEDISKLNSIPNIVFYLLEKSR